MKQIVKHLFFVLLLGLLILPFVQQQWKLVTLEQLGGAIEVPEKPTFSFSNIYQGHFQDSLNTYVENHIGFRPFLVRLYNQLNYSAFDIVSAKGVIKGKQGYLYEEKYLQALHGSDYVGDENLREDVRKSREITEWLGRHDKHLLVVLAPGKGSFFPEFAPKTLASNNPGKRNSEEYYKLLWQNQVPVIDGNSWFLAMKDTASLPLYPKLGIHWSHYGMGLVFDSIIKSMEHALGYQFIDFQMKDIEISHDLRAPDRDLWEGINILAAPDDFAMPYPAFVFNEIPGRQKPRVIVVADSYYWQWFGSGNAWRTFGENSFWYYNELIFKTGSKEPVKRLSVKLLAEVEAVDFIILLQTDANMDRYSFGFVDDMYKMVHEDVESEQAIKKIIQTILNNPDWLESIEEKARKRGYTLDEMIRIDAEWLYYKQKK